ncbi:lipoyl protein ligase domain-containing protein [Pseudobacteriovorax antillogorgiicola]|uniref:Lipoate-protein ligase A n=1 Tax=Pseudobacteriovorax antillogorgiicola TaxID=1513793 RepID=A0A1Y6B3Y5_9BACT|nr:hypothetical protein [Pseudobacteriovorax antillogorgiicola]TCS59212.1 lipoate-protein ligase A [Pseudobacteriovorax antillogorgiicola]SME90503.1 lipoate-protein ligase A [Pseudobacteriovorax antillogorgiicola]
MWIDDQVIRHCDKPLHIETFIPSGQSVVLGRSNKAELEVHEDRCAEDNIPVLKRYGGGGTVLLHPGCVVASVGCWVESPYNNDLYFKLLNQSLIDCFIEHFKGYEFLQRGFSDIVYEDRKFVGTSLFRSRQYLLYQASILVDLNIETINRYLQHPSKEPDYRKGRHHRDFLVGLQELDSRFSAEVCHRILEGELESYVKSHLGAELTSPLESHIPHLLKRANI